MRTYNIDITVKLAVPAYSQKEAEDAALLLFKKGKYNNDGAITRSVDSENDTQTNKTRKVR